MYLDIWKALGKPCTVTCEERHYITYILFFQNKKQSASIFNYSRWVFRTRRSEVIIPALGEELSPCALSKGQLWPETTTWLTLTWKDQPQPHNHRHQWLDHLTCKQPAAMESWHFSLFKWTQTICVSALCPTWAKYKCTRTRGHCCTVLWTQSPVVCVCACAWVCVCLLVTRFYETCIYNPCIIGFKKVSI